MAKRRKVNNMLGLAVLATVTYKPMHPYEMAQVLREWGKDQDMKIKWGSLYTVVQNLEKHGFLAVAGTAQDGGRPERTVYRITDAGLAEMADWVRELIGEPEREQPRFMAGLSTLSALSPDEVIGLLTRRLELLEEQSAAQRAVLAGLDLPRIFLVESEYELAMRDAEARWVRSLLEELTAGTLSGLDMWRAFAATRQVPAEIAELAERGRPTD